MGVSPPPSLRQLGNLAAARAAARRGGGARGGSGVGLLARVALRGADTVDGTVASQISDTFSFCRCCL